MLWTQRMCFRQLLLWVNPCRHTEHWYDFSLACMGAWLVRCANWTNLCPHTVHAYGRSPVCMRACLVRLLSVGKSLSTHSARIRPFSSVYACVWSEMPFWVNLCPHTVHAYGRSPVCMRACLVRCATLDKSLSTHSALIWPFSSVYACVSSEIATLSKSLSTHSALIRPFSGVYACMCSEMATQSKSLSTHSALIWPFSGVYACVSSEIATFENLCPHTVHSYGRSPVCVRACLVRLQFWKSLSTHSARYGRSPVCMRACIVDCLSEKISVHTLCTHKAVHQCVCACVVPVCCCLCTVSDKRCIDSVYQPRSSPHDQTACWPPHLNLMQHCLTVLWPAVEPSHLNLCLLLLLVYEFVHLFLWIRKYTMDKIN